MKMEPMFEDTGLLTEVICSEGKRNKGIFGRNARTRKHRPENAAQAGGGRLQPTAPALEGGRRLPWHGPGLRRTGAKGGSALFNH